MIRLISVRWEIGYASGILAEDHHSRLLSLLGGGDDFFFIYPVLVIPYTIGGTEIWLYISFGLMIIWRVWPSQCDLTRGMLPLVSEGLVSPDSTMGSGFMFSVLGFRVGISSTAWIPLFRNIVCPRDKKVNHIPHALFWHLNEDISILDRGIWSGTSAFDFSIAYYNSQSVEGKCLCLIGFCTLHDQALYRAWSSFV